MAYFRENKAPWLTDILLSPALRAEMEARTKAAEAGAKASAAAVTAATSSGGGGRPVKAPVGSPNGPRVTLADSVYGKVAVGVGYGYNPDSISDRWIGFVGSNSAAAGPYEFGREALSGVGADGRPWKFPPIPATRWLSRGTGVKG